MGAGDDVTQLRYKGGDALQLQGAELLRDSAQPVTPVGSWGLVMLWGLRCMYVGSVAVGDCVELTACGFVSVLLVWVGWANMGCSGMCVSLWLVGRLLYGRAWTGLN